MHKTHWIVALVWFCVTAGVAKAAESFPRFGAEEMLEIVAFSRGQPVALSPDGLWVSYVLPQAGYEWNILARRPRGYVFVMPLESANGEARGLSKGGLWSSFPTWSPDGRRLAFFQESDKGGRLAIWNSRTGRIRTFSEEFRGRAYLAPQWEAGGRRLVYAGPLRDPEPGPTPRIRVIQSSDERIPGDRFFSDLRRAELRLVELDSGRIRSLLEKPVYVRSFQVSPAGGRLIYTAPSVKTLGLVGGEIRETFRVELDDANQPQKLDSTGLSMSWTPDGKSLTYSREGKLWVLPATGGTPHPLIDTLEVPVRRPIWSPEGKQFVALVPDPSLHDEEIEPPQPGMYSIARPFTDLYLISARTGEARNLTSSIQDRVSAPLWSRDGSAILFRAVDNQTYRESVYRYDLEYNRLEVLEGGAYNFGNLSTGGTLLAYTRQDSTHPRDLWVTDTRSGNTRRLTELNPALKHFRFSKPELFDYYNADGVRLGALIYKPVDFNPARKVPVVTYVYEKLTPGMNRFSAQHQILLNHGYAVLMPNVKVKVGETGTSFVKCVVPAVNAVRAGGWTNQKFAIWGGSFGAYATSYLVTQTDLFACAVSRATPPELFRNWASGRDRDSVNIERGQARMGGGPFQFMERYLAQSAFFHLDRVKTPILIMHGVEDRTILFGEGEMIFYALRRLGKKATFVIYTHGDHSLSRHSRSDTLDVYNRMLDWFRRYLKQPEETVKAEEEPRMDTDVHK